jgi:sugar (pentulose or hexulose) kinase
VKADSTTTSNISELIAQGSAILGFELGSTRIKATLIGPDGTPIAAGSHGWENQLVDGVWTYDLDDVDKGMTSCFAELISDVHSRYQVSLTTVAAAGFSGMMHGYLALDEKGAILVPFRTWRNNITGDAAEELTELFQYPIPQRWSIAHLYQSVLNGEEHLKHLARITTLAGYVHWKLTGQWAIGTNDASGMFPVDPETGDFDPRMIAKFDQHIVDRALPWKLGDILPRIMPVGAPAGTLTETGARLLDPAGKFQAGVPLCPPEGDAGTGMVATNSVRVRTGNVSAGTSVFAMLVLEKQLTRVHPQIDRVLTPDGKLVGMAHSNNCTSDLDAWIALFGQAARVLGADVGEDELYSRLMPLALKGDPDAGGLLAYGYVSGEHVTGFTEGRPLFVRRPDSTFTIENVMRTHLFAALGALRTGLNILIEEEGVQVEEIQGHGGFFKTAEVGQRIMAAATNTTVNVLETAGEGGAWGMALLAAYMVRTDPGQDLPAFLDGVFSGSARTSVKPHPQDVEGFNRFFQRYTRGLPIEAAAVETLV